MRAHPDRTLVLIVLAIIVMVGTLAAIGRAFSDKIWIRDREVALPAARFTQCTLAAIKQVDGVRALGNQDLAAEVGFEVQSQPLTDVVGEIYRIRPGAIRIRVASRSPFTPWQERASDVLLRDLANAIQRGCAP
jgi:hypothetical protein